MAVVICINFLLWSISKQSLRQHFYDVSTHYHNNSSIYYFFRVYFYQKFGTPIISKNANN